MNIVVTGSQGLIGRHVIDYAATQPGVCTWGVDCIGMGNRQQKYVSADLTDFGQTVSALAGAATAGAATAGADAIVHLAAVRNHGMLSGPELFRTNALSTYNVLDAAHKLGIPRVVLASSIHVTRSIPRRSPTVYQYFPIDEDHPIDPQHDYALSKQVGELAGEMYARHFGLTVVSLRYSWVLTGEEIAQQFPWPDADESAAALYAYCDVRDAARATFLAATVPLPAKTHTTLFIAARDTFVNVPSAQIVQQYFPQAKICGLPGYTALVSGQRAADVLGFEPLYSCRG